MTGVPANGSATYPIFTAVVSRGVPTLSGATSYSDQWTYNTCVHSNQSAVKTLRAGYSKKAEYANT